MVNTVPWSVGTERNQMLNDRAKQSIKNMTDEQVAELPYVRLAEYCDQVLSSSGSQFILIVVNVETHHMSMQSTLPTRLVLKALEYAMEDAKEEPRMLPLIRKG